MNYSIGTTYEGKNFKYLTEIIPFVNHIEVSPDSIAHKKNGIVSIDETALKQLKWIDNTTDISILLHGVGLSIGSYDCYSKDYIKLLDELFGKLNHIPWHSEHLAYTMVNGENLGTMLTLPKTDEVLDMICTRVDAIQKKYKRLFLLENVISMLPSPACKYSDAAFLNKITSQTGCGLILDVYNLQCDASNFSLDVNSFLEELNLNVVYEMHLAGGATDAELNFKMDIHSQLLAGSTIELAQTIIDKNPINLKAITFEMLEEFIAHHGSVAIINELDKLSEIFNYELTAFAD
jgi:uncharacterized protein (UPF0276 family)